jgi:hypothetical protein
MKNIDKISCFLLVLLLVPLQAQAYGSYKIDYDHYDLGEWAEHRHRDLLELKEGIHDYKIEQLEMERNNQIRKQNNLIEEQSRLIHQRY